MRKQTTFLAVLSTAVFTASMAFPAYAKAAGWTEENGNWYYYDSYGDPLTDTWKKSGNDWYYLNADGSSRLFRTDRRILCKRRRKTCHLPVGHYGQRRLLVRR